MINKLSNLTDNINKLMQNNFSYTQTLKGICFELGDILEANVIVVNKEQQIIAIDILEGNNLIFDSKETEDGIFIDNFLNEQFNNIVEIKENLSLNSFYIKNTPKSEIKKNIATFVPIFASGKRLATMVLFKQDGVFSADDIGIIKLISIIVSLILQHSQSEQSAEDKRKIMIVKSALSTLSYSELEAILHIFDELDGTEGLLVASKVADRVGITRSVIVNALRKLESAGVIESRSLGMKGTFIKVLNYLLIDELNKLRD